MSYTEFYGLSEQPFSNTPDTRFFFESHQHNEAKVRILHAINTMKGLAVLVGDVGTGKTTLARKLLGELESGEYEAALLIVVHGDVKADWLLRKITQQLGVEESTGSKEETIGRLYERLMELYEEGRKPVIIVDEANMLRNPEIMEEFRGILNLEVPGSKLITFVLIGLPELDEWLAQDTPLKQRIALRFTLHALNQQASREYIEHRLKVAGAGAPIFTEDAFKSIFKYSQGTPRLINTICDNALLEGYLVKSKEIGADAIEDVVIGLGL